jgi:hypothetical protein
MDGIAWIVDMRYTLDEQCKIWTLSRLYNTSSRFRYLCLIREEVKREIGESRRPQSF